MANHNPNSNTGASQRKAIEAFLRGGNSLTALQALNHFGCARLAARIDDLRNAGLPIESVPVVVTNRDGKRVRVAEYRLAQGATA
jgi:hypothetical protein